MTPSLEPPTISSITWSVNQGNDTLIGGGEDYAWGGDGYNIIVAGHVTYEAKTRVDLDLNTGYAYHDTWFDQLTGVYWVKSGASNDKLVAGDRGVYFDAGDGLNTLQGGRGNDELHAGGGDDLFFGSLGSDVIAGDSGINTVDYINVASEIAVNLRNERAIKAVGGEDTLVAIKNVWGSNRDDSIIGDDGVVGNYLNGRWGNDTIEGLGGNDDLHGDEGHDKILGGFGQDKLYGDGGNDSLDGGDGADRMEGGAGNDTYTVDNARRRRRRGGWRRFGHGFGLHLAAYVYVGHDGSRERREPVFGRLGQLHADRQQSRQQHRRR